MLTEFVQMTLLLKTLADIKNNPWESVYNTGNDVDLSQIIWDYNNEAKLDDVVLWEELYYQPGNIGVYAAYNPYIEFYIIVYNLFADLDEGIETFYGPGSNKKVWERAKKLGVELQTEKMWISKKEAHIYQSLD